MQWANNLVLQHHHLECHNCIHIHSTQVWLAIFDYIEKLRKWTAGNFGKLYTFRVKWNDIFTSVNKVPSHETEIYNGDGSTEFSMLISNSIICWHYGIWGLTMEIRTLGNLPWLRGELICVLYYQHPSLLLLHQQSSCKHSGSNGLFHMHLGPCSCS